MIYANSRGTPEYLAPERAAQKHHDERLSDIWSLGITMYEIVIGRTPFEKDTTEEFLSKEYVHSLSQIPVQTADRLRLLTQSAGSILRAHIGRDFPWNLQALASFRRPSKTDGRTFSRYSSRVMRKRTSASFLQLASTKRYAQRR
jgi:serine/threonine protein kinase